MAWTPVAVDTLEKKRALDHDVVLYEYFSLPVAARHIREFSAWLERRCSRREIAFPPATDYTARLVPHRDGVAVPLEEAHILWQR